LVLIDSHDTHISLIGRGQGATLYVNTTGSGGAYDSIQSAIDASINGDTIFVYSGTYYENVIINKTISLLGEDKNTTIINGSNNGNVISIDVDWVNITKFTITQCGSSDAGIRLNAVDFCMIAYNNVIWNNNYGMYFATSSNNNIITHNNVSSNELTGLGLSSSSFNTIVDNVISENNLIGIDLGWSSNNSIINNAISSNVWEGVKLDTSSNNSIMNNNISNNGYGIRLYSSMGNNISNNNVSRNTWHGIFLYSSNNNTLLDNNIPENKGGYGIQIDGRSEFNVVANNILTDNGHGIRITHLAKNSTIENNILLLGSRGIQIDTRYGNNIINNTFIENAFGIYIRKSSYNLIINNTFSLHLDHGLYLENSSNNTMYHNNFFYNFNQAFDNQDNNYWDSGYPGGGNYWSDYDGFDNFSGLNQDIPGSDGLGDSNYSVDFDSIDNYPLMEPIPDTLSPRIQLFFPDNNSIIKRGTQIDFYVYDKNIDYVKYSINGAPQVSFLTPYELSTNNWSEGNNTVMIYAGDKNNNFATKVFNFTIDSINPKVDINSPRNNSIIQNGTILDFSITDLNLMGVNYSVNDGLFNTMIEPYNISTTNWTDGNYTVKINMVDLAGNSNSSWFFFTIDSVSPAIWFNPILNNSIIPIGKLISLNITDLHLDSVRYSLNGEEFIVLEEPFIINTTNWEDSHYNITIIANDTAKNEARIYFKVTVDATPPNIADPYIFFIRDQLTEILNITCTLTFTEPMNTTNIKNHISFSLPIEFNCTWNAEGTYLIISSHTDIPSEALEINITIDSNLTDINGVNLSQEFNFQFTYYPDFDSDGIVDGDDPDDDNDEVQDEDDLFPYDPSEWSDTDGDGTGDNKDLDIDGDGYLNHEDAFPFDPDKWATPPLDSDSDGIPDVDDPDDDNDGYNDTVEAIEGTDPLDDGSTPPDNDGDFDPDSTDPDDDNDGIPDEMDGFPLDPKRWREEDQGDFTIYVLLIVIIIIITLILVLLFLRQRKGKGVPSREESKEKEEEFLEVEVIEPDQ
jgi:parallel beta-helix repeat protein